MGLMLSRIKKKRGYKAFIKAAASELLEFKPEDMDEVYNCLEGWFRRKPEARKAAARLLGREWQEQDYDDFCYDLVHLSDAELFGSASAAAKAREKFEKEKKIK